MWWDAPRGRVGPHAGIRASRKRTVRSIAAMKAGPNGCPSSYHSRVASTPAFVMARWVARAHGGRAGVVEAAVHHQHRLGDVAEVGAAGSRPARTPGPRPGAVASPEAGLELGERRVGALELGEVLRLQATRRTPSPRRRRTSPGSAASAFIITPPPIERPKSAIRSGSTRTSSDVRSAWRRRPRRRRSRAGPACSTRGSSVGLGVVAVVDVQRDVAALARGTRARASSPGRGRSRPGRCSRAPARRRGTDPARSAR